MIIYKKDDQFFIQVPVKFCDRFIFCRDCIHKNLCYAYNHIDYKHFYNKVKNVYLFLYIEEDFYEK